MISILNFIFTVVFYAMRWTKLDTFAYVFLNQLIVVSNLQRPFVIVESTAWVFFIFQSSKIRVNPTGVTSFLSPFWCCLSSDRHCHTATPYCASFPWSQDELATFASSSINASSRCLASQVETKALNTHHHHRSPSSDRLTLTLYCYKRSSRSWSLSPPLNRVSIFAFFLDWAPCHRSST
jgi:hypothetical protein